MINNEMRAGAQELERILSFLGDADRSNLQSEVSLQSTEERVKKHLRFVNEQLAKVNVTIEIEEMKDHLEEIHSRVSEHFSQLRKAVTKNQFDEKPVEHIVILVEDYLKFERECVLPALKMSRS